VTEEFASQEFRALPTDSLLIKGEFRYRHAPFPKLAIAEEAMITKTAPMFSEQEWQFECPAFGGIVVGFDGSPASYSAIQSAAVLSAANGQTVHVVSVLPPMSSYKLNAGMDEPRSEVEDLRIQLRDVAMRDAIGAHCDRPGWSREVIIGNPSREIARLADKCGADLIILGRSQRGAIDRFLGADTTLQVMRCSSIPVLVVDNEMERPSTIVAAVDFRVASARAASAALDLLDGTGTLYLVYVEEPVDILGTPAPGNHAGDILVLFRQLLERLHPAPGVVVETVVLNGTPVPAIAEFCERVGADLLAVGTHSLSRVARALIGSVSSGLVRRIKTPILVAPAKE
jgi:nucleotide-binding universal stress UspA family protein